MLIYISCEPSENIIKKPVTRGAQVTSAPWKNLLDIV